MSVAVGRQDQGDPLSGHVPPVVQPPPGNPRFPLFDGLRAMAAISILAAHAALLSGYISFGSFGAWAANLSAGVAVFFVVSGFLLYRPFVAADMQGTQRPTAGRFYWRRFLRIFPAYWVALTLLSFYPHGTEMFSQWPKYYSLTQIYFPPSLEGLGQAWSLSVEVAFYAVLPLYALLSSRLLRSLTPKRRLQVEIAVLAAISAASLAINVQVSNSGATALTVGLPQFAAWFAIGMALASISAYSSAAATVPAIARAVARHPGVPWLLAALFFVVDGLLTRVPADAFNYSPAQRTLQFVAWGAIALMLVVPAALGPSNRGFPSRVLAHAAIAWLGVISYGIFLYHQATITIIFESGWRLSSFMPLRFAEFAALSVAMTVPLAAASYYLIERPVLRLKNARLPAAQGSAESRQ